MSNRWEKGFLPIKPFSRATIRMVQRHVREVRRLYDWPGSVYHDADQPPANRFNRWAWHNLPLLRAIHHDLQFIGLVSRLVGQPVKPSYVFLSMYGAEGVCPPHTDRPQCLWTVDFLVNTDAKDKPWPLYVHKSKEEASPWHAATLRPGEAVLYSGTGQLHYRKPLDADSDATFCDLAFFHFVEASYCGPVD